MTGEKWTVNHVSSKEYIVDGRTMAQEVAFCGTGNLILGATFGLEE